MAKLLGAKQLKMRMPGNRYRIAELLKSWIPLIPSKYYFFPTTESAHLIAIF
jgi:hypothetical protein